jgi:hypothetical protein
MAQAANQVTLRPRTLHAFEDYIRTAEGEMEPGLRGDATFLWSDLNQERARQVLRGRIVAQLWAGDGSLKIPDGLIHDWVGAVFAPDVSLVHVLGFVQDYDNHKNIYQPEVMDSRLIRHDGDDFEIFLRLLKKKIITVVLDTDHAVHYSRLSDTRCFCRSYTTRIAEVEDAGTAKERILEPDTGYGFLWRLYSYWKFEEKPGAGGVHIECRAISLTRDIPLGLGWIIEPIVRKLPQESLIHTLGSTRRGLSETSATVPTS